MLKPTLLTLTLITLLRIFASAQDTVWYDGNWKATKIHPCYYRTKAKTDSGWMVTDHYLNGKPQMTGFYLDDSMKIRQGNCRWFFQDGTVSHSQVYVAGKPNGIEQTYYDKGQLKTQGIVRDKDREGEWTVYFPSGKLAGKALYQANKRGKTTLYHEDGTRNTKDTVFERDSEYPGGSSRFLYFLNRTLRYPDSAVIHEIEGMVLIRFHISNEGKVSNLTVEQSVDPYLDAEALRVLSLMKDWEPYVVAGVPVESYKIQPVIFKLTNN
jgi:TonB family protein